MAYHSAKDSFSREEVLDILRRNVALYKNEPDFVNYIVDLALYLLDGVARESDGEENAPEIPASLSALLTTPPSALPPSARWAVAPPPPVPAPPVAPAPPSIVPVQIAIHPQTDPDFEVDSVLNRSTVQQNEVVPPPPLPHDGGKSKMPRVEIDMGGKTKVYKVFRQNTSMNDGTYCPVCGTDNPPKTRCCKTCGTVL